MVLSAWWVGGAALVWGCPPGQDSSTCLLFPAADGRLRGLASGGSGETHLGSPMAFEDRRALFSACAKATLSVSTAWQADRSLQVLCAGNGLQ